MTNIVITFKNIQQSDETKVNRMLEDGLYELIDGGFFEQKCRELGISNFCSEDWLIHFEEE